MNARRAVSVTLAAVAAVPIAALTSARPALAGPCQGAPVTTAYPFNGKFQMTPVNIRSGPGIECPSYGMGIQGDAVQYFCWRMSDQGQSWTYIGIQAAQMYGWVNSNALWGGGSPTACPTGGMGMGSQFPTGGMGMGSQFPSGGMGMGSQFPSGMGSQFPNGGMTGMGDPSMMGGNPASNPQITGHYGGGSTSTSGTTGVTPGRHGLP